MMEQAYWPLLTSIIVFIVCVCVLISAGIFFVKTVDILADRLKLGEAFVGGLFVGATTSIADVVLTLTATSHQFVSLAIGNALGGVAGQTVFLVLADMTYKKANLEHAAASLPNIYSTILIMILISIPLLAFSSPIVHFPFHPLSPAMIVVYIFGMYLVHRSHKKPMWLPRLTKDTLVDKPKKSHRESKLPLLIIKFFSLGALVGLVGWALARSGESLVYHTDLPEIAVGALFSGIATSLPEFIIAVIAIRQGALTLAVGNILGGNAFDVLQLPLADFVYTDGSIFHILSKGEIFLLSLTLLMTGIVCLGLLRREKSGFINIGFEGTATILVYLAGMITLFFIQS